MTEVEAILLGAVIGGTIGIIGSIIGNKMSRSTTLEAIRNTDFNKAAAVFRSAFTKELRELRNIDHPEELERDFVYNLIKDSIVKHEIAYIRFEPYFTPENNPGYSGAWRKYSNPSLIIKRENPDPLLDYYAEGKSVEDCIHLAISNIERLLEFAKPK